MANSTNFVDGKKANSSKQNTVIKSEMKNAVHYAACKELGMINKSTAATYDRVLTYINGGGFFNKSVPMVGNGDMTTTNALVAMESGLAHSPIRELNETSKRRRRIASLSNVLELIGQYKGIDNLHAYLVTLTVPNVGFGKLKHTWSAINRALTAMRKVIWDYPRRHGLHLTAFDGSVARWLGDFKSLELAINNGCLAHKVDYYDGAGLYHPHVHMLLLSDKKLDIDVTSADLFNFWQNQFAVKLSPDAFELKPSYSKYNRNNDDTEAFAAGLIEATKYITKPDFYQFLPDKPTAFSRKLFAEVYNASYGMTAKRSSGIMADSNSFLNFVDENKLGNAVLNASIPGISAKVPDLMSTRATLTNGLYHDFHALTPLQMLAFNSGIIDGSGFDSSIFDQVSFPNTRKANLFKYLFTNLIYTPRGKKGLMKRLREWRSVLLGKINALEERSGREVRDNGKVKPETDAAIEHFYEKLGDTDSFFDAANDLIDEDGLSVELPDYRRRVKVYQILNALKSFGFNSNDDVHANQFASDFRVKNLKYSTSGQPDGTSKYAFTKVCRLIGKNNVEMGSSLQFDAISAVWGRAYLEWAKLGFTDAFVWSDNDDYDAIYKAMLPMDIDLFASDVLYTDNQHCFCNNPFESTADECVDWLQSVVNKLN